MQQDINSFIYGKLQVFIFLTFEGYTYQPNSHSSEPDIENMQVIGFTKGFSRIQAFNKLLKDNEYLKETSFDELWCMRLADGGKYNSIFHIQNDHLKN